MAAKTVKYAYIKYFKIKIDFKVFLFYNDIYNRGGKYEKIFSWC